MTDHDHHDTDLTDPHGEAEALRRENARLRAEIAEATDPDFIWGAMDNVHDADTTLDDYAAAVSRAQRAALAASRAPDPVANADSCQPGDLISRAAVLAVAERAELDFADPAWTLEQLRALPAAPVAEALTPPPDAELDALVEALRSGEQADMDGCMVKVSRQACEEAADAITALRAQPDWKAMAERLGDELDLLLYAITATDQYDDRFLTITGSTQMLKQLLEAESDARAALSDFAKMKGE